MNYGSQRLNYNLQRPHKTQVQKQGFAKVMLSTVLSMNFYPSNTSSELSPACRCLYKTACLLHVYGNQWVSYETQQLQIIHAYSAKLPGKYWIVLALNSSFILRGRAVKSVKGSKTTLIDEGVSIPANIMLRLFCILCCKRRDVICEASLHSWINATLWLLTLLMKLQGKPEGH